MSRQADAMSLSFIALSSLLFLGCSSGGPNVEGVDAAAVDAAVDAADAIAPPPDNVAATELSPAAFAIVVEDL